MREREAASTKPAAAQDISREDRMRSFAAMLAYAKPYRLTFLAVFVCTFFAIGADLLQPYLVKVAIDENMLTGAHGADTLLLLGGCYFLLAAVSLVFSYVQANLLQKVGQSIVGQLRKDLFRHISKQSMSFFDRHPIGSLVTNVSSDTETINQFFTQVLLSLVRDGLSLLLVVAFMFSLDAQLALYCLLLFPVIFAIAAAFRSLLRSAYQRVRGELSRLIAFLAENLAGMSLIQAFHQEKDQTDQFTRRNRSYLRENLREVRTSILFNRSFDMLGNLSVAFVVWLGGMAVLDTSLEFGVLYAFINYIRQFFQPINQITQQWNTLQSTTVSMDRLWRIFRVEPQVTDPEPGQTVAVKPQEVLGQVDFNHIRFAYVDKRDVLHNLDLHIAPGEFIGIVGTTGAGKSSLVSLLARFYDARQGSVEIDGVDIRRMKQETLHRIVGLVQQDPYLYSGTIVDNVRLFQEEVPRDRVIWACQAVGSDSMIKRLKHGYDTRLSERGSGLSAGERQLISFARILVFEPRILILDEATAHLDSHTERLIQQALNVVSKGRTTIVIAHRLSTIQHADRIIVMSGGRVIEEGDHEALMKQGGSYAELVRHSRTGAAELQASM
ncbi:ABC transporter ATP-binding protein/permease [Paenibacillus thiaminolyticus]|uniref:ABC transporter ATP-binding protein n=1 Tax=Paenibacillus thiaminolyticus TaxID=49283 RepID=A0AAP9J3G3_PANTH|nr:ABC transporter ATP-binding protein [Paenibacillus thiaminolyticus]MCY9537413.1 ABC transporter ATP-binding protein/permease [Paenibacillus thiaminolyticus]MCY9602005.1 ABC transporter ATP-binding protein/permease [Paenibacillus thiaminolyticus]MCY9609888.1 ABC transporter ATP-binding protein/permease [Paenibacillus thiaminolyticus]MCY9613832.1 ABC transporter ATP-binding protein/permease [Paenibacillus thiaminolyticus]MCY9620734.1 ABC transporter ATP-binding protein/permease [Paenibacillus